MAKTIQNSTTQKQVVNIADDGFNLTGFAFIPGESELSQDVCEMMKATATAGEKGIDLFKEAHEKGKVWDRYYNLTPVQWDIYIAALRKSAPNRWVRDTKTVSGSSGIAIVDAWRRKSIGQDKEILQRIFLNKMGDGQKSGNERMYTRFEGQIPVAAVDYTGSITAIDQLAVQEYETALAKAGGDEKKCKVAKPKPVELEFVIHSGDELRPESFGMIFAADIQEDREEASEKRFQQNLQKHMKQNRKLSAAIAAGY